MGGKDGRRTTPRIPRRGISALFSEEKEEG